jgi:hypothetical protein
VQDSSSWAAKSAYYCAGSYPLHERSIHIRLSLILLTLVLTQATLQVPASLPPKSYQRANRYAVLPSHLRDPHHRERRVSMVQQEEAMELISYRLPKTYLCSIPKTGRIPQFSLQLVQRKAMCADSVQAQRSRLCAKLQPTVQHHPDWLKASRGRQNHC